MNRTFLIFLMIGTALVIAVIGDRRPPPLPGYLPWEIQILNNGNTRIFGITLNKTRIQDANQILSRFPSTHYIEDPSEPGLYAVYDQLNLGGFLARLELQYDIPGDSFPRQPGNDGQGTFEQLSEQMQMKLLDSRVKRIRYIPEVDYSEELILQHFGQADEEQKVNEQSKRWIFRQMGLSILVNDNGPDIFSYASIASEEKTEPVPTAAGPAN